MSDAQRQASAVNTGHLTWSGNAVRNHVPDFLAPRAVADGSTLPPRSRDRSTTGPPRSGRRSRAVRSAARWSEVDDRIGDRYDASEAIVNGDRLRGRIALVDRGGTPFVAKTRAAEAAEAIAVVVVDDRDEDPPTLLGGRSLDRHPDDQRFPVDRRGASRRWPAPASRSRSAARCTTSAPTTPTAC